MSIAKVFVMQTVFNRILLQREYLYKIYIYDFQNFMYDHYSNASYIIKRLMIMKMQPPLHNLHHLLMSSCKNCGGIKVGIVKDL